MKSSAFQLQGSHSRPLCSFRCEGEVNGGQIASEGAESFAAADCADSLQRLRSFRVEEITDQITKTIHPIHLL